MIFTKLNLTFLSILPFVVKGGSLRGRTLTQGTCTPMADYTQQSVFVLLELNGSDENSVASTNDTAALNNTFVQAYHYVSLCSQEGSTRAVDEAIIINAATELKEPSNFQYDFPRGNFTWLVEVDIKCNSCGYDNDVWQLFNDTEVGLTNKIETLNRLERLSMPPNECACVGPSQTDFLALFQTFFHLDTVDGRSSNVQIMNATQIPLLNGDECGIQPDTTSTAFYNYTGVCLSKTFRQFDGLLSDAPTMSPTGTDSPTTSPTTSPTDAPTTSPTASPTVTPPDDPTDAPTVSPTVSPTDSPSPTEKPSCGEGEVGCDRDEYGCIPSAGYSWCDLKKECIKPWETPCEESVVPTAAPTDLPILSGVPAPTDVPTTMPTRESTEMPILSGVPAPIETPTDMPILSGVPAPTDMPVPALTDAPTDKPVTTATEAPTTSSVGSKPPRAYRRVEAESNTSDGAKRFSSNTNHIVI
jgi:hypothetical protein